MKLVTLSASNFESLIFQSRICLFSMRRTAHKVANYASLRYLYFFNFFDYRALGNASPLEKRGDQYRRKTTPFIPRTGDVR